MSSPSIPNYFSLSKVRVQPLCFDIRHLGQLYFFKVKGGLSQKPKWVTHRKKCKKQYYTITWDVHYTN